jgi:hypothetical protein
MTSSNQPPDKEQPTGRGSDEGGRVIPFPRSGQDTDTPGDPWEFRTEVRSVGGAQGEWLRHELTDVLRDLLAWAHNDVAGNDRDDRQEQQAA